MSLSPAAARPIAGGAFLFADQPLESGIFGPEHLSSEAKELGEAVHQFIASEVVPAWEAVDAMEGAIAPALLRKFGDLGFFSMEIPAELGGIGMHLAEVLPSLEHLGRCGSFGVAAMVHQGIGMQPMVYVGPDDMVARCLPPMMSGEKIAAYCLTEPGSGSDALAAKTTAVFDAAANEWVINGTKQWITNASWAEFFTVFAQVEGDKFTAFLVERGQPGFEVMAEEHKLGIKGSSTCALRFRDVRVPAAKRIGDIGKGHKIALNMLNLGRLKLGTTMLGACKELIEHTIRYTGERHQFGKPINSFGLIRRKIAEMGALVFAGEAMAYRTAALIDAHMTASGDEANRACKLNSADEYSAECSLVKVFLTEAATICADHAVQCYGGYGFSEEYPVARFYRDVRVSRIYEGTNEINRIHAANTIVRRTFPGGKSTDLAASLESMINATLTDGTLGNMKRAFGQLLRAVGLSAGANGKIRLEQDVQGAIADAAMHLFAVDSSLRRAARAEGPGKRYASTMAELVQCRSAAAFVAAVNHAVAGGNYRIGGLDRLLHTIFDATRDQFQHERDAAEMMVKQ